MTKADIEIMLKDKLFWCFLGGLVCLVFLARVCTVTLKIMLIAMWGLFVFIWVLIILTTRKMIKQRKDQGIDRDFTS